MVLSSIAPRISASRYLSKHLLYRNPDSVTAQTSGMGIDEDLTTFGGRLRAARKARKMNQKALAAAVGISQSVVSDLENNVHAGSSHTVQLARAVGVNPLWLESNRGPRTATATQATQAPVPFDPETIDALLQLPERWLGRAEQAVREILKEYERSTEQPDDRPAPNYTLIHNRPHGGRASGKKRLK